MIRYRTPLLAALLTPALFVFRLSAEPAPEPPRPLLEATADGVEKRLKPSSSQVSAALSSNPAAPGVTVSIQPGPEGYPGITLTPKDGASWDLSAFGYVEAQLANTGAKTLGISLRVDNAGDWKTNPWNSETAYLKPGETGAVRVLFGYSYRKRGFALNPAKVVRLLLVAGKSPEVQSFRVVSIAAGGLPGAKPPVDPQSVRIKPVKGVLLGEGVVIDPAKQLEMKGAKASFVMAGKSPSLPISFPAGPGETSVALKPAIGRWDLRDCLEVRVQVRNDGPAACTPRVRLDSDGGASDWISPPAPLAPGARQEIVVPFAPAKTWNNEKDGKTIASNAVSRVAISTEHAEAERKLVVESITADAPPAPALPSWLGQRPPAAGEWIKTFDDEFDGAGIDSSKWNIQGPNYWDQQSHWSKENVLAGEGFARLRYAKKTGWQNDDPKAKRTDYAAGFLDTLGKWTQRYGYFEARVKLPTATGLWPSFWMMPDRGAASGNRQGTNSGGMELDIMEHLTGWGGYRYNIAMHWDGYGKEHKAIGSDKNYMQPDKEGFITVGLLWTPGSAVYYCNGREMLRWENARICSVPCEMMFTLPQGGWDNNHLDETQLPSDFVIDYVRVWQRRDLAAEADGKAPAATPAPAK